MADTTSSLWVCKAFYFFFFSSYMLRYIYNPVYFKQIGLSPLYVGIISGTSPFIRAFGGLLLCYVAEMLNIRKIIFLTSLVFCVATPFVTTIPKPGKEFCFEKVQDNEIALSVTNSGTKPQAILFRRNENSTYGVKGVFQYKERKNQNQDSEKKLKSVLPLTLRERQDYNSPGDQHYLKHMARLLALYNYYLSTYPANDDTPHQQISRKENITMNKRNMQNFAGKTKGLKKETKKAETFNNTAQDNSDDLGRESNEMIQLFVVLLVITIIGDFLSGPAEYLGDTATVMALKEDKTRYGQVRLWSNFGQLLIIPSVSVLVHFKKTMICDSLNDDYKMSLYILSGGMTIALLIGLKLKFSSTEKYSAVQPKAKTMKPREMISELKLILKITWFLLIMVFFLGAFEGVFSTFMFWYIVAMNHSQATLVIAVANFLRNVAALLTYSASSWILRKTGVINTVNMAVLLYGFAFLIYSLMKDPWLAIIPEVIQNSAFALTMAACVSYFGELASVNVTATAQGLLQFTYVGVGQSLGPIVGGYVIEHLGGEFTFLIFAGISCCILLFSIALQLFSKYKMCDAQDYEPVASDEKVEGSAQALNESKIAEP